MGLYREQARREWDEASRKAFWSRVLSGLASEDAVLLDFNDVSQHLHLKTAIYQGLQLVPLDKIVGSVGRYKDFAGAFLPVSKDMKDRWQRVATLYLDPTSSGAPPVDLYKVGDSYFVKDGNHRVSVANQLGMMDIEAYVWEYPAPVSGLDSDADIDTLLLEAERLEFLDQTNLDSLRPKHNILLTEPGGYTEMLAQIQGYQDILSKIDGVPMSYEGAVTAWYDMVYETTVQLIADAGVLDLFPERTKADFFVWAKRYQASLKERYDRRVTMQDVARQLPAQHRAAGLQRGWRGVMRWLRRRLA